MSLHITPFYAALLAGLLLYLSSRVIRVRRRQRVALGPGGDPRVERAMRVHANFVEYVPFALLLLGFAELQGAPAPLLHTVGVTLTAGRLVHAFGVSQTNENLRLRVLGMVSTFAAIAVGALSCLSASIISWW